MDWKDSEGECWNNVRRQQRREKRLFWLGGVCRNCARDVVINPDTDLCEDCAENYNPDRKPLFAIGQSVRLTVDIDAYGEDEPDHDATLPAGTQGIIYGLDAEDWHWDDAVFACYDVLIGEFVYDVYEDELETV